MTHTINEEYYGVGVDTAIAADHRLRWPFGENGARFHLLRPSVAALSAFLPAGGFCQQGHEISVANHGSHSLAVRDILTTLIATVAVGTKETFTLIDNQSLQGTWVTRNVASTAGAALVHDRQELVVVFGTWAGNGINLRDYCNTVFGYDGLKAASIYCRLHSSIVIGSESTSSSQPAFDTGVWPSGTTLLLEIGAGCKILGKGGQGGQGGGGSLSPLSQPGSPGGTAFSVQVDTALVNHGTISGGGGGGGGGYSPVAGGGGGGGGGCGYQPSLGGAAGGGAVVQGQPGAPGVIGVGGIGGNGNGGGFAGGFGGSPPSLTGNQGFGSGGLGGAAGNAIVKLSTITLNKIVAGTIHGPEVTV